MAYYLRVTFHGLVIGFLKWRWQHKLSATGFATGFAPLLLPTVEGTQTLTLWRWEHGLSVAGFETRFEPLLLFSFNFC